MKPEEILKYLNDIDFGFSMYVEGGLNLMEIMSWTGYFAYTTIEKYHPQFKNHNELDLAADLGGPF